MTTDLRGYEATHFKFEVEGKVAHITLNRPDRKNPLTFDSYAELRDLFHGLKLDEHIKAIVLSGAGGNFCSGGDVFEIIEPLTKMDMPGLLKFTRMTGAVVQEMRSCPQPVIAAVNGACAGAGAILAMASDLRFADNSAKVMFLFNRVGLAGCDMGACAILPRLIGQGRASELLYTGRAMRADEGERWGFFNRICDAHALLDEALAIADADKRRAVMAKIQKLIQDEGVAIQPYWRALYRHHRPGLAGCGQHLSFDHHHYKMGWL